MRCISIAVIAVALIVGCGSDKSTGPELTLAEKLVGEWEGTLKREHTSYYHIIVLGADSSYQATGIGTAIDTLGYNSSGYDIGTWEIIPGDIMLTHITKYTNLLTGKSSFQDWNDSYAITIEEDVLTMVYVFRGNTYTDTYTRKN